MKYLLLFLLEFAGEESVGADNPFIPFFVDFEDRAASITNLLGDGKKYNPDVICTCMSPAIGAILPELQMTLDALSMKTVAASQGGDVVIELDQADWAHRVLYAGSIGCLVLHIILYLQLYYFFWSLELKKVKINFFCLFVAF